MPGLAGKPSTRLSTRLALMAIALSLSACAGGSGTHATLLSLGGGPKLSPAATSTPSRTAAATTATGAMPPHSSTSTSTTTSSSRTAGSGTVGGINVEPSIRPSHYSGANPQSWWCAMPNCTSDFNVNGQGPMPTVTRELQEAKALGASFVRVEFPWPLIEPSSGAFDWSRADAIVQASQSVGEPLLPILTWTPQWAGGTSKLNVPATNVSDWTTFVSDVAQRYGSQFPAIDIWNEPDSGSYLYNGSAQTYVTSLLNPAYNAIKAVNPNIAVVEAGSANDAGSCCPFISAVIADGGRFDIASFHNYVGTYGAEAQSYRNILNGNGRPSTPLWMTEFGVQSASGNQSTAIQAVFGGQIALQAAAWYNLRDTGGWNCCPPALVDSATWGLLDASFNPKLSFGVLQGYLGGSGGGITCPAPNPNVVNYAHPDVQGRPSPGHYPSSAAGTLVQNGVSTSINEQLGRGVSNIAAVIDPTNTGAFSYQYQGGLAYQVFDPAMTMTLLVKPAATNVLSGIPLPAGTAPAGVSLSALRVNLGSAPFTFSALTGGVQLLQLPAAAGQSWVSASADPVDGTVVQFSAATTGGELVDVCGQWVQAWRVDGTLTLRSASASLVDKITLDIATQDGGLLIADRHSIQSGGLVGTTLAAVLDTVVPQ